MLMADFGMNQKFGQQSETPRKRGVYWKLNTKIGDFELPDPLVTDSAKSAALQHVRTRLNSFTPQEKGELINWGYALADAAMRRYVTRKPGPGESPIPAGALPMPQWPI
jgi:NTE family protein